MLYKILLASLTLESYQFISADNITYKFNLTYKINIYNTMEKDWGQQQFETKSNVDMNSTEVIQFMQCLKYVGSENLSKTQTRKARKEFTQNFMESAMSYPQWRERIDEIWIYDGRGKDWELENCEHKDKYRENK